MILTLDMAYEDWFKMVKEECPNMPDHLIESIHRYVRNGTETGGFLRACLENDLMKASWKADLDNRRILNEIGRTIYHFLPEGCKGSPEKVSHWISSRGLTGKAKRGAECQS